MSYFYGPVPSRRLGFSLGVDLMPKKICSFECLYCQLGRGKKKKIRRFSYIDLVKFKRELKEIIKKNSKIDYITISGSGEPTLHKDLDKIIAAIKQATKNKYPVCVITNSSLLYRNDVRRELRGVDLIIPSLDAGCSKTFHRLNRPHKDLHFKDIIKGLVKLRKECRGEIWLEIMLVKGFNDNIIEAKKIKEIIECIKPDKIQINIPVRPTAAKVLLPNFSKLERLRNIIAKDIKAIMDFSRITKVKQISCGSENDIVNFIKSRPATIEDLVQSSGVNVRIMMREVKSLLSKGYIKEYIHNREKYFVIND